MDNEHEEYNDIISLRRQKQGESFKDIECISIIPPEIYKIENTATIILPPSYRKANDRNIKYSYKDLSDHTLLYIFFDLVDFLQSESRAVAQKNIKIMEKKREVLDALRNLGYRYHKSLKTFVFILSDLVSDNKTKELLIFDRLSWHKVNVLIKIDNEFVKGFM